MPLSLICSVFSLTLENYKNYFMHIQDDVLRFLVTDFQSHGV